jgi:hypothetical protein
VDWPADLDPAALQQPDSTSCGAAAALAARAVLTRWRPKHPMSEIQEEHRLLCSATSARERFQMPWPQRLGTPPWALANTLRVLTDRHIATVIARPRPAIAYEVVWENVADRPVLVYIGSRWLPRHVLLAFEPVGDAIRVFDPAAGELVTVPRDRWQHHAIDVAGWDYFWFVV